jgi:hypothetical protein
MELELRASAADYGGHGDLFWREQSHRGAFEECLHGGDIDPYVAAIKKESQRARERLCWELARAKLACAEADRRADVRATADAQWRRKLASAEEPTRRPVSRRARHRHRYSPSVACLAACCNQL